jgi:hypothetical protein
VWHDPVYKTVEHPAEYKTVEHPAVTEEYWAMYFHDDGYETTDVNDAKAHQRQLGLAGYGGSYTTVTRTRTVTAAWTEQVLVKDAWSEQVLVSEGYWS